jgi:hypothetical protein
MQILKYLVLVASCLSANAYAGNRELTGTWKFEKSAEYTGKVKNLRQPELATVQIIDGRLLMQPKCTSAVNFEEIELDYSELFQDNSKDGIDENKLDKFLKKAFSFDFAATKHYYRAEKPASACDKFFRDLMVSKDRLLVARGGTIFFSYVRANEPDVKAVDPSINLYGRKLSQLPYQPVVFKNICSALFPSVGKGTPPKPSAECAPVYYPYVATKKDTDPLAKLIGSHTYTKNGALGNHDYDNPVARNLHPIYMLLPPLKDVLVVAVDDVEQGEAVGRSGIYGVYLAIKNGKVTDQINRSCVLNEQYTCADESGKKLYQLLDTGKFNKLD